MIKYNTYSPLGKLVNVFFFIISLFMVDIVHSVAQSLMDLFTKILGLVDGCKEGFTSLSLF